MRPKSLVVGILLAFASVAFAQSRQPLDNGWEFYQGQVGSIWEIWRGDRAADNVAWQPVTLPHCFNARDSVDPDGPYYQGPGWYRTRLSLKNPFPNGRTLTALQRRRTKIAGLCGNGKGQGTCRRL